VEELAQLQSELCKRYSVPVMSPAPQLKLGVSANFFSGKLPLNGLRHPPEPSTCGWFLWAGEELSSAPDFFQSLHVDVWRDDSLLVI
jgi:hypothetical protein